jgi:hypothetical protein
MKSRKSIFLLLPLLLVMACSKGSTTDGSSSVPYVAVSTSFNITAAPYTALTNVGGVVYLANVGYRGIMVYRINATPSTSCIVAFDRACTYDVTSSAAIVVAQNNGTAICTDCGSTYALSNGNVNTGPSTIGLKEYTATLNTSTNVLTITN